MLGDSGMPEMDGAVDGSPAGSGRLELAPDTLDFGRLAVGSDAEQRLTVSNAGAGPLTVDLEDLAPPFTSSRMFPLTIPPGANRTVIFTFAPEMAGAVEQIVRFVPDAGEARVVTLTGIAAMPEGEVLVDTLDFGVGAPGMAAAEAVTVRNASANIPLNVIGTAGLEAPFSVPMGQLPTLLSPGAEAQILVQFNPEMDGEFTQTLTINTDGGTFEVTVTARVVTPGDMTVTGLEPAWVVAGQETTVIVHGGPFPEGAARVTLGETALSGVERLDAWRLRAVVPDTLMADAEGAVGLDLRVDAGEQFGVAATSVVVTPPVESGRSLTLEALTAGPIGPDGNPWRLAVAEVPGEIEVSIEPGTVILAEADQRLRIAGVAVIGGEGPPVIFSAANAVAGAWGGLNFDLNEGNSTLQRVVVEFAGAGEAAVVVERALGLTEFVVRQSASDGLRIEDGTRMAFYSGELTDIAGDGIVMAPASSIFRFQNSRVRGVQWPMRADVGVFGRLPLGAGHDWADNAHDAIGIRGGVSTAVTLPNQPAGLAYRFHGDVRVLRGGELSFASGAPLVLDGVIEIRGGTLTLPAGLRVPAEGAGAIVADGGTFAVRGTAENPVVIGLPPDALAEPPMPWIGVDLTNAVQADVAHLTILGAGGGGENALRLPRSPVEIPGLIIESSAAGALTINGQATLTASQFRANQRGITIAGGSGSIEGVSTDEPAVDFVDVEVCADWNLETLLDGAGEVAPTNCP